MDKSMILRELQILLEAVNEQFEIIREYDEAIPQIEFDLIMENVRKLYETFHRLKRINDMIPSAGKEQVLTANSGHNILSPPEAEVRPGSARTTFPSRPAIRKDTQPKQDVKTAEPELFTSVEPPINTKLREAREKSLGPRMSRHESFKAAIGINDKFMFINELFDGNLREYNECIETLSGFKILSQAMEYLDLLRRKNNWQAGSNAFRKIRELLETRY